MWESRNNSNTTNVCVNLCAESREKKPWSNLLPHLFFLNTLATPHPVFSTYIEKQQTLQVDTQPSQRKKKNKHVTHETETYLEKLVSHDTIIQHRAFPPFGQTAAMSVQRIAVVIPAGEIVPEQKEKANVIHSKKEYDAKNKNKLMLKEEKDLNST